MKMPRRQAFTVCGTGGGMSSWAVVSTPRLGSRIQAGTVRFLTPAPLFAGVAVVVPVAAELSGA